MNARSTCSLSAASLILTLGLASAAVAAGPSFFTDREVDSYPPAPGREDNAPVVEAHTIELATLNVSNGSVIVLMAAPELGQLGYAETVPPGSQPVLPYDQLSPLEIFLALAPAELAVPSALVDLATDETIAQLANHRSRTDRHVAPIEVSLADLDLGWEPLQRNNDMCGPFGEQVFTVLACQPPPIDPADYNAPIDFCDAGLWIDHVRSSYLNFSWRQRERSYARTKSCGANVTIRQQVWSGGAWQNLSTQFSGPGGFIVSAWNGGLAFRRVTRERTNNAGGFRAYTDFYIFLD